MMFEVGKKYKRKGIDKVFECLSVFGNYGWVKSNNLPMTYEWSIAWYEYVEPHKEYFNAYKSKNGKNTFFEGPFNSLSYANNEAGSLRHGILTVTHHSDTKVETHFEVVPRGKA
jgi:hypothetical protein